MKTVSYEANQPTADQFAVYQDMFRYFNSTLFGSELPGVMLNFSRKARVRGFFAPARWNAGEEQTHEISLNPEHLGREPIAVASTLVHEMVHLWQQVAGSHWRHVV